MARSGQGNCCFHSISLSRSEVFRGALKIFARRALRSMQKSLHTVVQRRSGPRQAVEKDDPFRGTMTICLGTFMKRKKFSIISTMWKVVGIRLA